MRYSKGLLGQLCSLLACLTTAVNTIAIISPSQPLSSAFETSSLVNVTVLDDTIDPRFSLRAIYVETSLPLTPCFMNAVELLAQYAELDWMSKARQRHGVVLPSYPQVEIAVLPEKPATSVEVRLVIWGIWVGVRQMITKKRFCEVEFEIHWEGEVVASIFFTRPMDLQDTSNNGTLTTVKPLTLLSSPNETTDGILDILNSTGISPGASNEGNFDWKPLFPPGAKTLTVTEVFLTVMAGLINAAPRPASNKVPGPYASAASDIDANVQFFLHRRRLPRTKPPYFQYIHVIKALRLVPGYMLANKRFAEMLFIIEVTGVPVGEGYLERGHYVPPGFVLGNMIAPKENLTLS